jgi:hypothetical protein
VWRREQNATTDDDTFSENDLTSEDVSALWNNVGAFPRPTYPIREPWEISLAALVAMRWQVPGPAKKALGLLDRFGAVKLTPDEVALDGQAVNWSDVLEVRLSPLYLALADGALSRELERLRRTLPPVPGRAWLLRRAQATALALTQRFVSDDGAKAVPVPTTLVVRSKKQTKTVQSGVVTALLLAAIPEARSVLSQAAAAQGAATTTANTASESDVPAHHDPAQGLEKA